MVQSKGSSAGLAALFVSKAGGEGITGQRSTPAGPQAPGRLWHAVRGENERPSLDLKRPEERESLLLNFD